MKYFIALIGLICINPCSAQKVSTKAEALIVTYFKYYNGQQFDADDPIIVLTSKNTALLTSEKMANKKKGFPFEQTLVDFTKGHLISLACLNSESTIMNIDSSSLAGQKFELSNDTKTILGYKCRLAKTIVNSNAIELWYTNDFLVKGSPSSLGQNLGLILEYNRNKDFRITAVKLEELTKEKADFIPKAVASAPAFPLLDYRDLLWKSRFTTLSVFKNQHINSSDSVFDLNAPVLRFAKGTIVVRKIKFPKIGAADQVFLQLDEKSNGDAYDRIGSVFVIPMDGSISFMDGLKKGLSSLPIYTNGNGKKYQGVVATANYSPLLELMHFITPFGVNKYNTIKLKGKNWQDQATYRQEITELSSVFSDKEVWIGAFISTFDTGGHKVNMDITIHPDTYQELVGQKVIPLFNTTNVMEVMGQEFATMFDTLKGLEVEFDLPKDCKNVILKYITTGHGGWENGDEFLRKKNTILLDNKSVFSFIPWRQDCGSYRLSNPSSGNFNNGISSSDLSRSNWCPGTLSNPIYIDLGDLKAGKHKITVSIPMGKPEASSFSSWMVSGCLLLSDAN